MIGSKLIFVGLVVATAATAATANDLASSLSALSGGLTGNGLNGGGFESMFGGKKEGENSVVVPTKSQDKTEIKPNDLAKKDGEGFLGMSGPSELIKLMLNPFELCAKIAEHFKLSFEKFFPAVKRGLNFGLELAVQPFVLSLKIIEKVFVPDNCKLKFACKLAHTFSFTRDIVPKLGDKVLNESKVFKALCDGIHSDCDSIYQCDGHPKIKEEYKDHHHHEHGHGGEGHHHEGHHEEGHHEEPNYSPSNILAQFKSLKLKN